MSTGFLADQEGFLGCVLLLKHSDTNLLVFKTDSELDENTKSGRGSFQKIFSLNFPVTLSQSLYVYKHSQYLILLLLNFVLERSPPSSCLGLVMGQ